MTSTEELNRLPHELVEHVSWLIYARRRELRSRRRKLSGFKPALLTLAHLRKGALFAQAGAGFGVSEATAWRYVDETLADQAYQGAGAPPAPPTTTANNPRTTSSSTGTMPA